MAVRLTEEQLRYFKDLEENFDVHVATYRSQKELEYQSGAVNELRRELDNHERYVDGCRNMQIDDIEINVRFFAAKLDVLRELLGSDGK